MVRSWSSCTFDTCLSDGCGSSYIPRTSCYILLHWTSIDKSPRFHLPFLDLCTLPVEHLRFFCVDGKQSWVWCECVIRSAAMRWIAVCQYTYIYIYIHILCRKPPSWFSRAFMSLSHQQVKATVVFYAWSLLWVNLWALSAGQGVKLQTKVW